MARIVPRQIGGIVTAKHFYSNFPDISALQPQRSVTQAPPSPANFEAGSVLAKLMEIVEDRRKNPPAKSYTTSLFQGGTAKIGGKITEEAAEVVEAAGELGDAGRKHLTYEAADLVYHLWVLLGFHQIPLAELEAELARRFGISGLDEKAARPPKEAAGG